MAGGNEWNENSTDSPQGLPRVLGPSGSLTLSEEDLVLKWEPPGGPLLEKPTTSSPSCAPPSPSLIPSSKSAVQRPLPSQKPKLPKTSSLRPGSLSDVGSPKPRGLLRSFSDMSAVFSALESGTGTTADDLKPPIPLPRRRHTQHRPVILGDNQVHPLKTPSKPFLQALSIPEGNHEMGTKPRHQSHHSIGSELPPFTPRQDTQATPPLMSMSCGGLPLCPSPELPEDGEATSQPLSMDPKTPDMSMAREDSQPEHSGEITPGYCPRSRSMINPPSHFLSVQGPATPVQRHMQHSMSMSHRRLNSSHSAAAGDSGCWWSGASGTLTPRGGSSRALSPCHPPPPLRLGPLVKALAEGDVEGTRDAACNVRVSLKGSKENKNRLIQAGGILSLVQLIKSGDPVTIDHGVTALFNVCRSERAAEEIESAGGLEALVGALGAPNSTAKENAAAAIFCLADAPEFRRRFCEAGAIPALVDVLRTGSVRGQKDAALALFNLLRDTARVKELVEAGGVNVLLSLLQSSESGLEDKVMAVLAFVTKCQEGREVLLRENGLIAFIDVLELASQRAREDAVAALFNICNRDVDALAVVAKEGIIPALHKICQSPSERAKAKARALLQLLRNSK